MSPFVVEPERSREVLGIGFEGSVEFASLLLRHGEERGLIGPREVGRLWSRHIVNSAAVAPYLPPAGSFADLGSGAGLPGVVLALMRPDLACHLVEPMERRAVWLREVVETLGLTNTTVHQCSAQEASGRVKVDAVTARAVASLEKLLVWSWPLILPGGSLVVLKGAKAEAEVEAAAKVLRKLRAGETTVHVVDLFGDGDVTRVVEVRRSLP